VKYKSIASSVLVGMLAVTLAACGGSTTMATPVPAAQAPTAAPIATSAPTAITESTQIDLGVSGSGEVVAVQDADLVFKSQGTVAEVYVVEGDMVKKGDLLAILDTRTFDQALQQAQATLASAEAQEAALNEPPKSADEAAARAALAQAQAALNAVLQGPKAEDLQAVDAALEQAKANLQSTRNQLSLAKTNAEKQVQQATEALTRAQAAYSQAKNNWDRVQETGNDPNNPKICDASGKCRDNKLNDPQRESYYSAFIQAEAAMRQAELTVEQAVIAAEEARKAEIVGIQIAEQIVAQAQANADKLRLPPDEAQVAAARAGVANAQAALQRLQPDPTDAQKAMASAAVAQALAGLELARINRENAEIRAPFDGIIAQRNIDPGDPSASGQPALKLVDISKLRIEVQISDVDVNRLEIGQTASIYLDSMPGKVYTGKVSFIAPTATTVGTLRTYLVRVDVDDQTGLRVGMSARVDFDTE
jgi:HlyD family secretion protein